MNERMNEKQARANISIGAVSFVFVLFFLLKSLGCQPLRVLNRLQRRETPWNKKKKNLTQTVRPIHPFEHGDDL